ncbi:hypothetical protein ACVWY2_006042 [Bradyrhizobium sp. JR6.1]
MKQLWRRVDAEIEADRAAQHHDQQERLRRQRRDARADMDGDEQTAGCSRQGEAEALQDMGKFSDAATHCFASSMNCTTGQARPFRYAAKAVSPQMAATSGRFCAPVHTYRGAE